MEATASAKYLRGSAQKARLVVDMIRGKRVGEALAILRFTNKRAALGVEKCLRSAIANATETAERQNVAVDPDDLFVKTAFVDMGPTKNRRRAQGQGQEREGRAGGFAEGRGRRGAQGRREEGRWRRRRGREEAGPEARREEAGGGPGRGTESGPGRRSRG